MDKGTKLRFTIHNILYDIKKNNIKLDSYKISEKVNLFNKRDISFIYNVCLNTMRYSFHCEKIIKLFVNKKQNINELILLKSAITQIVFLNFTEYAVVNSSVNIAKKINIYHGFINSLLKKISFEKQKLKMIEISFTDLPDWFVSSNLNLEFEEKESFLNTFYEEPSLHFVFKNKNFLESFENNIVNTSNKSGFVNEKIEIQKIDSYKKGYWWIQDFSSFYPLQQSIKGFFKEKSKIKAIDLCAAPGGKGFQLLADGINVTLNDKNKKRINTLKKNLLRLEMNAKILNCDVLDLDNKEKYNLIILDAPCTAIGTIRKNPEIFFKRKGPDLYNLKNLQSNMLNKAASLLENNGIIIYMVCSFIKLETFDQIDNFLSNHRKFSLEKISINEETRYKVSTKNNCLYSLPFKISNYKSDGYFAAILKKSR